MAQIVMELRDSGTSQVSCPDDGSLCLYMTFSVSQGINNVTGFIDWSGPISYTLSSGQIIRSEGADSRVLANNITTMTFKRNESPRIVWINLETSRETTYGQTLSASLDSAVQLRN